MVGFDLNNLLNGKSKAAAQKAEETAEIQTQEQDNSFKVVMIDVEDLMPSKDNFYSTENIEELAVSIELAGGIEQNLVVKPQAHGKHEVIAGHRRRLAVLKLVNEGKEEYRKVPCRIKTESDAIKDKLSLIFTNATARQLTDWEKIQQAKELKEVLEEYKKALDEEIKAAVKDGDYCKACRFSTVDGCECEGLEEEDKAAYTEVRGKDCPCYERERMGRIRELVAQMLNTSTTQIGRMEAIENNLSLEFKEELEKGNINISTAHELSRLDEEKQAQAYTQYEEKGELHIKDVKEEPKPEITDEQTEWVQKAVLDAIKGNINRDIFKARGKIQLIEKSLRKHFGMSFKGTKVNLENGKHFIYRFGAEGIVIIDMNWKNFLVEYADLAEIVDLMIESNILQYDDAPEAEQAAVEENRSTTETKEETEEKIIQEEPMAAVEETEELPGQMDMSDYPKYVPEPTKKGLSFQDYLVEKYGTGQYKMIKKVVRDTILLQAQENNNICPKEWEDRITNAVSIWLNKKSKEYQKYLQG